MPRFALSAATTLACTLLLPACAQQERSSIHEFDEPVDRVLIDIETGDVSIHVSDDGRTNVDGLLDWRSAREPDFDAFVTDGTLHVKGDCPAAAVCRTDAILTIPKNADLELELTTGDVDLRGTGGNTIIEIITGKVEGFDLGSEIVDARTATGSIDLRFADGAVDVAAKTITGHIDLTVPNREYDVQAEVTTGDVEIRVDTSGSADASIWGRVTTGDFTVRPN